MDRIQDQSLDGGDAAKEDDESVALYGFVIESGVSRRVCKVTEQGIGFGVAPVLIECLLNR